MISWWFSESFSSFSLRNNKSYSEMVPPAHSQSTSVKPARPSLTDDISSSLILIKNAPLVTGCVLVASGISTATLTLTSAWKKKKTADTSKNALQSITAAALWLTPALSLSISRTVIFYALTDTGHRGVTAPQTRHRSLGNNAAIITALPQKVTVILGYKPSSFLLEISTTCMCKRCRLPCGAVIMRLWEKVFMVH